MGKVYTWMRLVLTPAQYWFGLYPYYLHLLPNNSLVPWPIQH
jgi:hypothetical protein